jgi:hypothetical protein
LFVPELEQVLFVCSKAGTSKMRLHDACLVRTKTNSLIAYLLRVLGLCGPIRNLLILPHRVLTARGSPLARRSRKKFWQMAMDYQESAAKLSGGKLPDIGNPPIVVVKNAPDNSGTPAK